MKFINDLFTSFDKCQPTGAIFDMVDHYLLLDKLHSLGFDQNSLLWFNSYLHNRQQYVSFQGSNSDYMVIDKGVPQGSTLGPLLFYLFINDLPKTCSHSSIQLYADDTVIYSSHSHFSYIQSSLQSDLNSLKDWFYKNKLILNKNKSCSMVFFKRCHCPHSFDLDIRFEDGSLLSKVVLFKYIGH